MSKLSLPMQFKMCAHVSDTFARHSYAILTCLGWKKRVFLEKILEKQPYFGQKSAIFCPIVVTLTESCFRCATPSSRTKYFFKPSQGNLERLSRHLQEQLKPTGTLHTLKSSSDAEISEALPAKLGEC